MTIRCLLYLCALGCLLKTHDAMASQASSQSWSNNSSFSSIEDAKTVVDAAEIGMATAITDSLLAAKQHDEEKGFCLTPFQNVLFFKVLSLLDRPDQLTDYLYHTLTRGNGKWIYPLRGRQSCSDQEKVIYFLKHQKLLLVLQEDESHDTLEPPEKKEDESHDTSLPPKNMVKERFPSLCHDILNMTHIFQTNKHLNGIHCIFFILQQHVKENDRDFLYFVAYSLIYEFEYIYGSNDILLGLEYYLLNIFRASQFGLHNSCKRHINNNDPNFYIPEMLEHAQNTTNMKILNEHPDL
ncbi:MAG: hypothetical protein Q8K36_07425, partial [Alphaproteobacteria bacterium]|nr:hypothetical protein [Alphaproteobacteria bacterium]